MPPDIRWGQNGDIGSRDGRNCTETRLLHVDFVGILRFVSYFAGMLCCVLNKFVVPSKHFYPGPLILSTVFFCPGFCYASAKILYLQYFDPDQQRQQIMIIH
jgi:hypothetical protein